MATPVGRAGPQPYPPAGSTPVSRIYTGRQDPLVTDAARSGNNQTTEARHALQYNGIILTLTELSLSVL